MKKFTLIISIMLTVNLLSAQWTQQNPYYPIDGRFNDVCFVHDRQGYVVGSCGYGWNGFHNGEFTFDGGDTWGEMIGIDNIWEPMFSICLIDNNIGWIAGGGIYHTINASSPYWGGEWYFQTSGPCIYNTIFFVDSLTGWAFGVDHWWSDYKLAKTCNGGSYWELTYFSSYISDFYFFDQYTGYAVGRLSWGPNNFGCILKTNDGGSYWLQDTIYDCSILNSICFIDQQNGWVVGGINWPPDAGYISHTSDGGSSWITQLSDTIPPLNAMQFTDELNGWAVGDSGTILHTTDGGENWQYQESNTTVNLYGISFVDSEQGWICGDSCIILHTDNGGTVGIIEVPQNTNKLNIFPNPSNTIIHISFELNKKESIVISILTIQGQEVKQISLQEREKGQIDLDCSKFSSGIYFINLQTENGILTEKLIIE